jgi:hypothetical protein
VKRRAFLTSAAAVTAAGCFPRAAFALDGGEWLNLQALSVRLPGNPAPRESMAARVLLEESAKRCGLAWTLAGGASQPGATVYLGTVHSWSGFAAGSPGAGDVAAAARSLKADGYVLRTGGGVGNPWIAVCGADERGLLFGVGALLRSIVFARQAARVDKRALHRESSPRCPLRGHQLGYRPKTNAYDGWTVAMWDQYIRDLAIFGTNAIELLPPRTDDAADSPHFPLPQARMMVEMSRIADSYGLDVWVWYPAMDKDYGDPHTVSAAVDEWIGVLRTLPRVDAIFVPGGDPGHTQPDYLMALLEKQKRSIARVHPKVQMWVSPQGFNAAWLEQFLSIVREPHTQAWLDGIVFGPQSRMSTEEFRKAVPERYPIRFYPDITHSVSCQYPVPDWDVAYALTEGREIINPRPVDEANILRQSLSSTIGFITYSEGCNDDVNKFLWSALGWNPDQPLGVVLREFSRYFIGAEHETGFAQGLLNLERNWRGSLAVNEQVDVTLAEFRDMEASASPFVLENWRWQQAMYRAFYDAFVRRRLLDETAALTRARDLLSRVWDIGWPAVPLGTGEPPADHPANGIDPSLLLEQAQRLLAAPLVSPAAAELRTRVLELGYALLQSIHMQLAVDRYQGEAVNRGANLDTLDAPVTDVAWMRAQIGRILQIDGAEKQIAAIRQMLSRTDPGPGGFYDELGNPANRPHLLTGDGARKDPEFRHTPEVQFNYPDKWGAAAPIAWKHWAGSLFDAALQVRYDDLDPSRQYRVRVVYAGGAPQFKIRMMANEDTEVHPYMLRSWPPAPQEFAIPAAATASGTLTLSWTREAGLGGNGVGCQVAEVWLMPVSGAGESQ